MSFNYQLRNCNFNQLLNLLVDHNNQVSDIAKQFNMPSSTLLQFKNYLFSPRLLKYTIRAFPDYLKTGDNNKQGFYNQLKNPLLGLSTFSMICGAIEALYNSNQLDILLEYLKSREIQIDPNQLTMENPNIKGLEEPKKEYNNPFKLEPRLEEPKKELPKKDLHQLIRELVEAGKQKGLEISVVIK